MTEYDVAAYLPPRIVGFAPEGGEVDAHARQQLQTCMDAGDAVAGVLCADHHVGYSQPIGGVVAYSDYISPSGVGYDIGCGNKAVGTSLLLSDVRDDLPRIMDEINRRISFGMGQPNNEEVKDHPIYDRINRDAPLPGIRNMLVSARRQLGTVGSGNHYVDLFAEEKTDRIWIGVHFGSRGFGHKIASGFMALAAGKAFDEKAPEGEMDSPPVLLHVGDPLGHLYIEAMELAGEYAYAGRDTVVNKVLEILGNPDVTHEVHNHHNFAWLEDTPHGKAWVIRKGATPLYPGQQGFVGGSMGENAVIIEGIDPYKGFQSGTGITLELPHSTAVGMQSLWSAPHGAGRAMSRTEAKGKSRKRWNCYACGEQQLQGDPGWDLGCCPVCASPNVKKIWVKVPSGKVDWKAVQRRMKHQGIELRGAGADEAPEAYKRLPEVLEAHSAYVEVIHSLRPIGVVMADENVKDAYKD